MTIENLPARTALIPIENLNLSVRAYNALKWRGVNYLGQLLQLSRGELAHSRNIGKITLQNIHQAVNECLQRLPEISDTPAAQLRAVIEKDARAAQKLTPAAWLLPERICGDLDAPVERLDLSSRMRAALTCRGIKTVRQLVAFPRRELMSMANFGKKSETEIQRKLFAYLSGDTTVQSLKSISETTAFVERLLSTRTKAQRRVIRGRYGFWDGNCKSLQHISEEMGVTRERVRQIENSALTQIRNICGQERIEGFVRSKIAAYMTRNGETGRGSLGEDQAAKILADGGSTGQALLALAFLRDLYPHFLDKMRISAGEDL